MDKVKNGTRTVLRPPELKDIAPTLMLLLASRAATLNMLPFGAAFFAAAYDKSVAYLGLAAALIGTLSAAGPAALPKYLTAMTAYWLFTRLCRSKSEFLHAVVCGATMLAAGLVTLLAGRGTLYDCLLLITESVICTVMYIVFSRARAISESFSRRERLSAEEYISASVAAGVMLAGLGNTAIGPVRVTNILAVYIVLLTALNSTVAVAGSTGLCIGFITTMSSSASLPMMGVFGMMAVFASFMSSYKRVGCAIGGICGAAVGLIYAKNMFELPMSIYDAAIGAAIFAATPAAAHDYMRVFFVRSMQLEAVDTGLRMREYLAARLRRTSEAFVTLGKCFYAASEGRLKKYSDDIGGILDSTAERVCSGCKLCGKCWQTDFRRTYKNILELISIIESSGALTRENIPPHFCERCIRTDAFIKEINHVYELYKHDLLRRSDAVTARDLVASQYFELGELFEGMSLDIESEFRFLEAEEEKILDELDKADITPLEVSAIESAGGSCEVYLRLAPAVRHAAVEGAISKALGRSVSYERTDNGLSKYVARPGFVLESSVLQLAQAGSDINGDSVTVFTNGQGRFYAIAADGMGSGSEAKYESAAALRLLTSFLKAGFEPKTALGILNSSMCLNMESETYSTIDLLCVDLYTGRAELYKIGGAETIVYNGSETRAITSASAPVGILSGLKPNRKRIELKEGDVVLMMTDGITGAGYALSRTEWIKNIVKKPHENMDELAREVMDTALEKSKGAAKDDMSVIALRLMSV